MDVKSRPRAAFSFRVAAMNWDAEFTDLPPIKLDDGRTLKRLADCRDYILALAAREQSQERWQAAAGELLKAAQHGGPFLFASRVTFSRALRGLGGDEPSAPTLRAS